MRVKFLGIIDTVPTAHCLDSDCWPPYNVGSLFDWGWTELRVRAKELRRTRKRAAERYKERMKAEQEATTNVKKKK